MPATVTAEQIYDRISELLIAQLDTTLSQVNIPGIEATQKIVNSQGQISVGRSLATQKLVLFSQDIDAHVEDNPIIQNILLDSNVTPETLSAATLMFANQFPITFAVGGTNHDISGIVNTESNNPINLGQFLNVDRTRLNIDPIRAKELLNTNVFELLSRPESNQATIDSFFSLWTRLKKNKPNFEFDVDDDGVNDTWESDLNVHQDNYSSQNDISSENPQGGIIRLDRHAGGVNTGKTLQSLHRELSLYLSDVLKPVKSPVGDLRPAYEPKSDGYIKFRHLNQGMIIRKQEGQETGIEKLKDIEFNPLHPHSEAVNIPSYLADGFTITMWVRFLDKSTTGTLFNYGNPLRNIDPKGFRLETYVLNQDDRLDSTGETWGEVAASNYIGDNPFFEKSKTERFIRLVVRDHIDRGDTMEGKLYDSHFGLEPSFNRGLFVPDFGATGNTDYSQGNEKLLLTHTRVPMDYTEWFFIVASYNPTTIDDSEYTTTYNTDKLFWEGNINPDTNQQTHRSGYGSKCKIEVISKSQLLRARGYKV